MAAKPQAPIYCTWAGCNVPATHVQISKDGSVRAYLCQHHHNLLESALGSDARLALSYWVKAQGGAAAAAKRMLHGR